MTPGGAKPDDVYDLVIAAATHDHATVDAIAETLHGWMGDTA